MLIRSRPIEDVIEAADAFVANYQNQRAYDQRYYTNYAIGDVIDFIQNVFAQNADAMDDFIFMEVPGAYGD